MILVYDVGDDRQRTSMVRTRDQCRNVTNKIEVQRGIGVYFGSG